jgi:hypothetical protein
MAADAITINRAPVLTLWAAVLIEVLGSHGLGLRAGRTGEEDRVWVVVADP